MRTWSNTWDDVLRYQKSSKNIFNFSSFCHPVFWKCRHLAVGTNWQTWRKIVKTDYYKIKVTQGCKNEAQSIFLLKYYLNFLRFFSFFLPIFHKLQRTISPQCGVRRRLRGVCSECRLKLQKSAKRVTVNCGGQLLMNVRVWDPKVIQGAQFEVIFSFRYPSKILASSWWTRITRSRFWKTEASLSPTVPSHWLLPGPGARLRARSPARTRGRGPSEWAETTRPCLPPSSPSPRGDLTSAKSEPCWSGHQAPTSPTRSVSENFYRHWILFKSAYLVDEFIQVAKEKYGYNAEQALGMLFWHKHDLDR